MARKQKAVIEIDGKPRRVTFLNDADGLSAKDYLLLVSTGVFFVALTVGFISVLIGRPLGEEYFALLGAADAVVITVVGGVMSVNVAEIIRRPKDDADSTQNKTEEETPYE